MFRLLRQTAVLFAAAAGSLASNSATAATYSFDFTKQSIAPTSGFGTSACSAGLATCASNQRLNLGVYGGHLNSTGTGTSSLSAAAVEGFRGAGLGVLYGTDKGSDATHQIDNYGGGSDIIALVFDQAVTLSSIFRANYSGISSATGTDTDASYLAYTGQLSDLANGMKLNSFSSLLDAQTKTNSTALSNVWFIAAKVDGQTNDAFKLSGISVNTASVAAVPEPATWAMMLVGFGGIGFAMRRRKSKVTTSVTYA